MPQPMQNIKDSSDPTTTMNKALALVAKAFKINNIPINNNQRSSVIPRKSQIAQPGMNSSQDIKMQMVAKNIRNQKFQISMGMEMLLQHRLRGNGSGINGNPIRCYNCRGEGHYASNTQQSQGNMMLLIFSNSCRLLKRKKQGSKALKRNDTLQQPFTSGTQSDNAPIYDSDGSKKLKLLKRKKNTLFFGIIGTQNVKNANMTRFRMTKAYNDMKQKIERLQAQLGDLKGTTKGTRTNTRFTKQSILGKPPSSSSYKPKLYFVTPFPKSLVLPKVDKTNALSKPFILNSAPSTRESKVMQTVNMITPRIFRVNNTAKTKRPHLRSNSNNDRVPSKSKSSCLSNNIEKIEENHRNS
nr:hypothetical protein [Tanacetum cinerariifolium]GEX55986.1 hypothetical protein [Tanacetum cinerariifolium]